jgi:hypothetical protein
LKKKKLLILNYRNNKCRRTDNITETSMNGFEIGDRLSYKAERETGGWCDAVL